MAMVKIGSSRGVPLYVVKTDEDELPVFYAGIGGKMKELTVDDIAKLASSGEIVYESDKIREAVSRFIAQTKKKDPKRQAEQEGRSRGLLAQPSFYIGIVLLVAWVVFIIVFGFVGGAKVLPFLYS